MGIAELGKAIRAVLPFDVKDDKESVKLAKAVLTAVGNTVCQTGKLVIPGLGIFYVKQNPGGVRLIHRGKRVIGGQPKYSELVEYPPNKKVKFKPCRALVKALRDEE